MRLPSFLTMGVPSGKVLPMDDSTLTPDQVWTEYWVARRNVLLAATHCIYDDLNVHIDGQQPPSELEQDLQARQGNVYDEHLSTACRELVIAELKLVLINGAEE